MILCAALKHKATGAIIGCCRHGDGYSALHDLGLTIGINDVEEGFLNDKGEFLSRKQAFGHAFEIGQLSMTTFQTKHEKYEEELYSEDLY